VRAVPYHGATPFTRTNIKHDIEDIGAVLDSPAGVEFNAATKPLGLERSALSHQVVPPGARFPYATRT
jgi:hypothetical protein